jgi:hypothetical protein
MTLWLQGGESGGQGNIGKTLQPEIMRKTEAGSDEERAGKYLWEKGGRNDGRQSV